MKIGKKMEKSINSQIQAEFESSYLYLSMAAWFEDADLPGCAHWMEKQAHEEWEHGMKFYKYLVSRGGRVVLGPIAAPKRMERCRRCIYRGTRTRRKSYFSDRCNGRTF